MNQDNLKMNSSENNSSIGLTMVIDVLMIFAPILGYIAQLNVIKKTQSSQGFSKKIILILLVANILRIFFWFGKRFAFPLLLQSVVMILMQIELLRQCVKFDEKRLNETSLFNCFWEWSNFSYYIILTFSFIIFLSLTSQLFTFSNSYYVEVLGYLSATVEACLGLPQVIANYNSKSTKSLSIILVSTWLIGDLFKTYYYMITSAPAQMTICGMFQIIIDCLVFVQIFYYNTSKRIIEKKSD
jgi:hypothetical protein